MNNSQPQDWKSSQYNYSDCPVAVHYSKSNPGSWHSHKCQVTQTIHPCGSSTAPVALARPDEIGPPAKWCLLPLLKTAKEQPEELDYSKSFRHPPVLTSQTSIWLSIMGQAWKKYDESMEWVRVYFGWSNLWYGSKNIHINYRTQGFPREHRTVAFG